MHKARTCGMCSSFLTSNRISNGWRSGWASLRQGLLPGSDGGRRWRRLAQSVGRCLIFTWCLFEAHLIQCWRVILSPLVRATVMASCKSYQDDMNPFWQKLWVYCPPFWRQQIHRAHNAYEQDWVKHVVDILCENFRVLWLRMRGNTNESLLSWKCCSKNRRKFSLAMFSSPTACPFSHLLKD